MQETLSRILAPPSKPMSSRPISKKYLKVDMKQTQSAYSQSVHKLTDRRSDHKAIEANNKLNEPPTTLEIGECLSEIRGSAPRKDNIRIEYMKLATKKVKDLIYIILKKIFHERAPKWDEILKSGQIVPLHKKADRNDVNN